MAPDPPPVFEEDVGEGRHDKRQKRQKTRCPLIAELVIHLDTKQRKDGSETTSHETIRC